MLSEYFRASNAHDESRATFANSLVLLCRSEGYVHDCTMPVFAPPFPCFDTYGRRMKTFKEKDWPIGTTVRAETLAEAGLFYMGRSDRTVCLLAVEAYTSGNPTMMGRRKTLVFDPNVTTYY